MHVIGTAGHVDHGKSTLVKALTGIDPDRLRVEKEREMSIVLGFAWLTLPSGEQVGVIDVPGHRDFIKNMLAGVGGIDAALLVIAADEGVMPQTREHLAILDLIQVNGGIIVLTKTDLVDDEEWLELVMADVSEQVEGTCLRDAPIVPVSAATGQGLDVLIAELEKCLQNVPPRANQGRPRLSVDRVFTMSGFGTVVTGTLVGGVLAVGDEVEILPSGRRGRVRGLQMHRTKIEQALPGSRVAINLGGVNRDEVQTGETVSLPGLMASTRLIDVRLTYLADAPLPLKHNAQVDFFCGAAEIPAHVRLLGAETLGPGETGWAQLVLRDPVALARGDRFILRWLSPSITVGGGVIVDPTPTHRHRRFRANVIEQLETLAFGSPDEIILQALEQRQPVEARELLANITLPAETVEAALKTLLAAQQILVLDDFARLPVETQHLASLQASSTSILITPAGWQDLETRLAAILSTYHTSWPLRRGMSREELRSRLQERGRDIGGRLFNQIIARAVHTGRVSSDETLVWLASHRVHLSPEQEGQVHDLLAVFRRDPYATPSMADCESKLGPELFNALVENETLVQANAEVLFLGETFAQIKEQIIDRIRREGSITLAQVRDMYNTSRKYAVAMLETLDEQRITKRQGDVRVLR